MDPLQLLTRDETRVQPFLTKHWIPFTASTLGFIGACAVNFSSRRPVLSGIQKHVIGATIGWLFGTYANEYRENYLAERDAVLRHYVELHPEDFPAPERKKFKDVMQPWVPIR